MAALIYILCTLTALLCSVLLLRGYRRSRAHLLFADRVIILHMDLSMWRVPPALLAVALLLYGLVWKRNKPTTMTTAFLHGAIAMGLATAVFFLRSWRDSRDRLFVFLPWPFLS